MNFIAPTRWHSTVTESMDMNTPEAPIMLKPIRSLVLAIGLLAALPGTAAAQNNSSGSVDFCDTTVYQNTTLPTLQTSGLFTDVPRYGKAPTTGYRPDETCRQSSASDNSCNVSQTTTNPNCPYAPPCKLSMCGQRYANINDMWITILGAPGTVPVSNGCWDLRANVQITVFNNNKGVGFVTNYNPSTKQGLYFGLFDSAARLTLQLYTFDASVAAGANIPMIQVGTTSASQARTNPVSWYTLSLDICSGPATTGGPNLLSAIGSFQPVTYNAATNTWAYAHTPGTCPNNNAADQVCFQFNGLLPTSPAISVSGAAGVSGFLHSADQAGTIDEGASVTKFTFVGTNVNPD